MQTKRVQASDMGQIAAPPIVHEVLAAPGQALDAATRSVMEPRFGYDFSGVRVHADAGADAASAAVGARAFTVGADIVFRRGEFAPHTQPGRALLAHELAHVAQRQTGRPQLFRKEAIAPHYPTEEEQRKIEKILSREGKKTAAPSPTASKSPAAPDTPVEKKQLNSTEVLDYVKSLKQPFFDTLAKLDTGQSEASGNVLDKTTAFEVVKRAREAIYKHFGVYASRSVAVTEDQTTTPDTRKAANQVLVTFGASPNDTISLARTIIDTHCIQCRDKLSELTDESKEAVVTRLRAAAFQERGEQLRRAAGKSVGGSHSDAEARIRIALKAEAEVYGTAVHELIHALVHPAFHAAFIDERNIVEGFTEYFTRQIVSDRSSYQEPYEKISSVRSAMSGPFLFPMGGASTEESLRLAYFRGRLELIGWRPSGPKEQQAVEDAGGSAPWDTATARRYAATYRAQAQAKQGASRNILGVGLYFTQGSDDKIIAVRYARVLARTEPYARGQLLLEGQLLGSPVQNPNRLGASLGIAVEYQEPYFYFGGGVRLIGTAAPAGGGGRLDVSPFVGAGIRAWQILRVGGEGFVLLPLTGQDIQFGGGITLGIEFK